MLQKKCILCVFLFKRHKNGVISTNLWAKCGWQSVPIPLRYHSDVHGWWVFGEKYPILLPIKIYVLSIYFATKHVFCLTRSGLS